VLLSKDWVQVPMPSNESCQWSARPHTKHMPALARLAKCHNPRRDGFREVVMARLREAGPGVALPKAALKEAAIKAWTT
jgi:hypothetical protein